MALLELLNPSTLAVTGTVDYPLEVRATDRLNANGDMLFSVYVGSPGAASLIPGAYVRWTDGGYSFTGIVESVVRSGQPDGTEILTVTCAHIARELGWWTAGLVRLSSGDQPLNVQSAISSTMNAFRGSETGPDDADWAVSASTAVGNLTIYLQNDGASIYTVLKSIADKVGAWLVRGTDRTLTMTATWTASGITARAVAGDKPANVAALLELSREVTAAELVTRVYPYTAGNAAVRVGVDKATASPAPYSKATFTWDFVYKATAIFDSTLENAIGTRDRWLQFPDINPLSNSNPDIISAANALQAAAINWLKNQAKTRIAYTLTVDDSPAPVMPGQSLTVQAPDLDTTLYCVEATHTWAPGAPLRSVLRVTDGSPWLTGGVDETVQAMESARVYRAHAQLAPNVYQLSYNKPVDAQYSADFRFRFDEGITQVLFVALDVQLGPLQSTVRAVAAQGTKTSIATPHNHGLIMAAHSHTIPDHSHTVPTLPAHTHPIPFTRISGSPTEQVMLDLEPSPILLQVIAGTNIGQITTFPTQSTGTGSGATSTVTGASTVGALVTDGSNADYTTTSAGTHDHTVDFAVSMEYGIFRDAAANAYAVGDLEYQINGGAWAALSGATSLGDGWYRIPLTNALVDASTFYPLNKSNKVTIRAVAISSAVETYATANTGAGQFNRWDDSGTYVQQVTGTAATALALSNNGWLYLLRRAVSPATVEIYAPDTAGTWALWGTEALSINIFNAICIDVRTGVKWVAGNGGAIYGWPGAFAKTISGTPTLINVAAVGGNVYARSTSTLYRVNTNAPGYPVTSMAAVGTGLAARNDGRIVSTSTATTAFALRVYESDLSTFVDCVRNDTGNTWTVGAVASAANLVHLGCSDGKVRTYILDLVGATATLAWTSPGAPGATGYPSNTNQLGVAAVLSSKAAMIDAQLTVRSVVQAIVMN